MKIHHISDTHNKYYMMPYNHFNCDVLIHTGDAECNTETDFMFFLEWFSKIPAKYKIYVAGNHDLFIEKNEKHCRKLFNENNVIYLNKESVIIDDIKFYGDPMSPRFGNWAFMADRSKMFKHWEKIPDDVDVLLTHTPPKGILDLTENKNYQLEFCGCKALNTRIKRLPKLKYHLFGHIHCGHGIENVGLRVLNGVTYSNAAAVEDGRFDKGIIHYGNILDI